jgi:uncharacterized membrane protein
MDLLSIQIPAVWLIATWAVALALFGLIARNAFWALFADPRDRNVFLGACLTVLVLWRIRAGIEPGLSLHLLGATGLTLMFRPLLAMLATAVVAGATALLTGNFAAFALNWLVLGAFPVALSWMAHRAISRWLPANPFVYFFLNAFANAGLSMVAVGALACLVSFALGLYPAGHLLNDYLPFYLLMAWGEAFLTGALVTLMVVWKPEWIATFSDARYLGCRPATPGPSSSAADRAP